MTLLHNGLRRFLLYLLKYYLLFIWNTSFYHSADVKPISNDIVLTVPWQSIFAFCSLCVLLWSLWFVLLLPSLLSSGDFSFISRFRHQLKSRLCLVDFLPPRVVDLFKKHYFFQWTNSFLINKNFNVLLLFSLLINISLSRQLCQLLSGSAYCQMTELTTRWLSLLPDDTACCQMTVLTTRWHVYWQMTVLIARWQCLLTGDSNYCQMIVLTARLQCLLPDYTA